MAYKKEELQKQAVEILASNENVYFAKDLWIALGVSKRTAHKYKLHLFAHIKKGLKRNKSIAMSALRSSWLEWKC